MGCSGHKGMEMFDYDKHPHKLYYGNENHSVCILCKDDVPAGFCWYCELCINFTMCIECKKKEEEAQCIARAKAAKEKKEREEAERKRREEEEKKRQQELKKKQQELAKKNKRKSLLAH